MLTGSSPIQIQSDALVKNNLYRYLKAVDSSQQLFYLRSLQVSDDFYKS